MLGGSLVPGVRTHAGRGACTRQGVLWPGSSELRGSIRWACPWELLTKGGQSQTGKGGYPHVGGGRNQNMKLFT